MVIRGNRRKDDMMMMMCLAAQLQVQKPSMPKRASEPDHYVQSNSHGMITPEF